MPALGPSHGAWNKLLKYGQRSRAWLIMLMVFVFAVAPSVTQAAEWSGYAGVEVRGFPSSPVDPRQSDVDVSLILEPELFHEWDEGRQRLVFRPHVRLDSADDERSHVDLRELYWQRAGRGWTLDVGLRKVFWGVTESVHLVDIVNQTDAVDDLDGEAKLGQPMVRLSLSRDWGQFDVFVLPGFRERTFPGVDGRLRTLPAVDTDRATYESSAEKGHVDAAIRWSRVFGDLDVGVSHFRGTSREPVLLPFAGGEALAPFYPQIDQTGVDVQVTRGAWLLKLEVIARRGDRIENFLAGAGGFEYTLFDLGETGADVGLIVEYLWDERDELATTPFGDDVFLGARLALNDVASTELLVGGAIDRETGGTFLNLEGSRRLGDRWVVEVRGRAFVGVADTDLLAPLRRDDYLQLTLKRYF